MRARYEAVEDADAMDVIESDGAETSGVAKLDYIATTNVTDAYTSGEITAADAGDDIAGAVYGLVGTVSILDAIANTDPMLADLHPLNDEIYGTDGADVIDSGDGADVISGLEGDDTLFGGAGADRVHGGYGNDTLYGGADNDVLIGWYGGDTLFGGYGDDELYGDGTGGSPDETADALFGEQGHDKLHGNGGDDVLFGDDGNDALFGDAGADKLDGGTGSDRLTGGAGRDMFVLADVPFQSWHYSELDVITDFAVHGPAGNDFQGDIVNLSQIFDQTTFTGTNADQAWAQGYLYFVQHGSPGEAGFGTTVYIDPNGKAPDEPTYYGRPYDIAVVDLEGVSHSEIGAIGGSFYGLAHNFLV